MLVKTRLPWLAAKLASGASFAVDDTFQRMLT
jgi:hypothetical protein